MISPCFVVPGIIKRSAGKNEINREVVILEMFFSYSRNLLLHVPVCEEIPNLLSTVFDGYSYVGEGSISFHLMYQ